MGTTQSFMERVMMSDADRAKVYAEQVKRANYERQVAESMKEITGKIVDAAYHVHKELGPGLLEGVYEGCLQYELEERGLEVKRQLPIAVRYKNVLKFQEAYRLDLLVENKVVIELKSVEKVNSVHKAQLLTYMKLSGKKVGLLLTFNTALIKQGITRMIL